MGFKMPNGKVPKRQLFKQVAFLEPVSAENSKAVAGYRACAVVLALALVALVWLI